MMIPIEHVKAFSECPRYYHFLRDGEAGPIPFRHMVIESIIKEAHLQAIETGYKMDWKRVVTLVDAEVFSDVDINDPEKASHARQLAEYILETIRKWYHDMYLSSKVETFVDISLKQIVNKHTLCGTIPLIEIGADLPVITVVSDLGMSMHKLYNDLSVRSMAWLVQKELGCEAVKCTGLGIGVKGGLDVVTAYIGQEDHLRTEQVLSQIVQMIATGIDYPSATEKCQSCVYTGRCKL